MDATMNVAVDQVQDWHHDHGMWIGSLGLGTDQGTGIVVVAQSHMLHASIDSKLDTDQN